MEGLILSPIFAESFWKNKEPDKEPDKELKRERKKVLEKVSDRYVTLLANLTLGCVIL